MKNKPLIDKGTLAKALGVCCLCVALACVPIVSELQFSIRDSLNWLPCQHA